MKTAQLAKMSKTICMSFNMDNFRYYAHVNETIIFAGSSSQCPQTTKRWLGVSPGIRCHLPLHLDFLADAQQSSVWKTAKSFRCKCCIREFTSPCAKILANYKYNCSLAKILFKTSTPNETLYELYI